MVSTFRDITSVVNELKGYCARILEPDDGTLTSIQREAARNELIRQIKMAGISFDSHYHYDDSPNIKFTWLPSNVGIKGTGTVTDVSTEGHFPISLSLGDEISVAFEPRNLATFSFYERCHLPNTEFAALKKGSAYEFQGMVYSCRYDYDLKQSLNGRFKFSVERGDDAGIVARLFRSFFKDVFG